MVTDLFGWIGAICFALSAVPQMFKSIKEGHSQGIAHGTIWLWLIGEAAMIVYAWLKLSGDLVLMVNYLINLLLVGMIAKYKYFPRK